MPRPKKSSANAKRASAAAAAARSFVTDSSDGARTPHVDAHVTGQGDDAAYVAPASVEDDELEFDEGDAVPESTRARVDPGLAARRDRDRLRKRRQRELIMATPSAEQLSMRSWLLTDVENMRAANVKKLVSAAIDSVLSGARKRMREEELQELIAAEARRAAKRRRLADEKKRARMEAAARSSEVAARVTAAKRRCAASNVQDDDDCHIISPSHHPHRAAYRSMKATMAALYKFVYYV